MATSKSRLTQLVSHFLPSSSTPTPPEAPTGSSFTHRHNFHTLSPTSFLPRAAAIEPDAPAVYHVTANNKILRRTYQEVADRARGFAYYLRKHGFQRVGLLCPNTPAFLESIFGIAAAGAVSVGANYRLKRDDIKYIFNHAEVDVIIVDAEFEELLGSFREAYPHIPLLVDADNDAVEGELAGLFDAAVIEGLEYDRESGATGWAGLQAQAPDEEAVMALAYTSGTTARPKGVEYTHRGAYLAAVGNVIESGLNLECNVNEGEEGRRCRYLWTLPMFHAVGTYFGTRLDAGLDLSID
ncbi:hypothetical protein LTS18_013149 [Coniosporium uncinatum]|uniref:Uncharacterized protein n=1 Tax=Coniosporium uncinatum TaxID=93489 RepID=A0ACC3DIM0_9PEZI|nr:hypothetical protein LTS18_013149 [Coniosporium uncinatum]